MRKAPDSESSPHVEPRPAGASPPRVVGFQFSIRSMLIAMTAVAVAAALGPLELVAGYALNLLLVYLPAVGLAAFAWYARGMAQTFVLGALGACLISINMGGLGMFAARTYHGRASVYVAFALFQVLACLACGYTAVAVRRLVQRRGWDRPGQ